MSRIYKDKYDCIVIGGSLSGLASALTLAKKGYSVLVLEQHNLPGGVATSFIRGGIEIEASLHEMMSIGPTYSPLKIRNFFDEMGIDIDWLRVPEAYRFVEPGLSAVVHAGDKGNFDVPAKDICDAVGDPDGKIFEKLMKLFTLCHNVYNSVNELSIHPVGKVAMLSKHSDFVKTAGYSAQEVLDTFGFPKKVLDILSAYWIYVGSPLYDLPFTIYAVLIADYLGYGSYIPKKFSHEMSLKMAEKAMEMGVQIEFGVWANKIIVDKGRVTGVLTVDRDLIKTDYVICSTYPNLAYNRLIEPKTEVPQKAIKTINARDLGLTCFSVVLLLDRNYKDLRIKDYSTFYSLEEFDMKSIWENYASVNEPYKYITSICTNIANPDASPAGTCLYSITALPRPDSWKDVTPENYRQKKNQYARWMIEAESKRLGVNLFDHIKEIVIETPITIAHYTSAYKGSIYGYRHQMADHIIARLQMSKDENYIHGLAFCGAHGISGDGMSPAITNGRKAAKTILEFMALDKGAHHES